MNVKQFVEKYHQSIRRINYAEDRKVLLAYSDQELLLYASAGAIEGGYTTAFIFRSARKTMAFLNGHRTTVIRALQHIENMELVKHMPQAEHEFVRNKAVMEAF